MKVKILILLFALIVFGMSGCAGLQIQTRTEFALGTYVSVRIDGISERKANRALDAAFGRLHEIELIASAKNADSELFYVNQHAYEREVNISAELFYLLETGLYYSEITGGAFDITLGAIVELWGIGTENAAVPAPEKLAEAVENSGFEWLVLDSEASTVRFLREGLQLDLGALAKGYAADEMTQILRENGVTNAILDLGGDIFAMGSKDGAGWLIGLASPRNADEICAKLRVSDMAIVTSGDYERYFMHENTRYHHIFDRRTGYPADSGIISATVIADSAMRADAMSTAIFVTGVPDMHIPHSDMRFIFIDSEMNITYSEDLNLEIVN